MSLVDVCAERGRILAGHSTVGTAHLQLEVRHQVVLHVILPSLSLLADHALKHIDTVELNLLNVIVMVEIYKIY